MTRWEYCLVMWMPRKLVDPDEKEIERYRQAGAKIRIEEDATFVFYGRVQYAGGEEKGTFPDLDEAVATLGMEGWEMVSHTEVGYPVEMQQFWFKRPAEE